MRRFKILIVEDEIIFARDIKQQLEKRGYIVFDIVQSGEDAVEKSMELEPDLVLMDISLDGEMDGIEAAQLIKSHRKVIVIYLTALTDKITLLRTKKIKGDGFMSKPININKLCQTIDMLLINKI